MDDLADLYQELILDHNKRPRNRRRAEAATCHVDGHNPLCGDKITLYVTVDDAGVITDVSFEGAGCAISTASASILTETIAGKTVDEARAIFESFVALVGGEGSADGEVPPKLKAFAGVGQYPARVKCATLAWRTLEAALAEGGTTTISTE